MVSINVLVYRNWILQSWGMSFGPWWRHQMETFSAQLAVCAGNSPGPVNSPQKGQWRGALMVSLICVSINGWVNNREAGDLRRNRGHYDVILMSKSYLVWHLTWSTIVAFRNSHCLDVDLSIMTLWQDSTNLINSPNLRLHASIHVYW